MKPKVMSTLIPCTNQTNVKMEAFGFHDSESLKLMTTAYTKIHAHAAVTNISIVR